MPVEYIIVALVALFASGLTLFSGFGLGTVLMPVLALLFPLPVAIAATAVVHLANNVFKLFLVGRHANWQVVIRFGIAAGLAAVAGAYTLGLLSNLPVVASYELLGEVREIHAIKLAIGSLIIAFAFLELSPKIAALAFPPRFLTAGGLLSGFFGGLSGNQGKKAFVGTSVVTAIIVDTVRITVYGRAFQLGSISNDIADMVAVAIVAAFLGAYIGVRLLEKVTLRFMQLVVAALMIIIGSPVSPAKKISACRLCCCGSVAQHHY
jgi:uncharacterized membrane protein YfcA